MQGVNTLFYVLVLIMSVVVHEMAHGFAAESQGDPTARYAGRLSLNPLKHIDPVGSVLLPLLLVFFKTGFVIGWAKPVPYDERNLRDPRWGTLLVASAGILVNIGLAVIFGVSIRFAYLLGSAAPAFVSIAAVITEVNIVLALFNLIPIPPLDGSRVMAWLLPDSMRSAYLAIERFGIVIVAFLLYGNTGFSRMLSSTINAVYFWMYDLLPFGRA